MEGITRLFSARPSYQVKELSFMRHIIIRDNIGNSRDIDHINNSRKLFLKRLFDVFNTRASNIHCLSQFSIHSSNILNTQNDGNIDTSGAMIPEANSYEVLIFSLATILQVIELRLRFDFHQEYITMTFILDFDKSDIRGFSSIERYALRSILGLDQSIIDFVSSNPKSLKNSLYSDFWRKIDFQIGLGDSPDPYKSSYLKNILSNIAGDELKELQLAEFLGFCYFRNERNDNIMSSSTDDSILRSEAIGQENKCFVNEREAFFQEFLGGVPSKIGSPREDRNAILCEMLDGVALYASSLGKARHSKETNKSEPAVEYLLIYGGHSAERAGRLIRLLHVLGEMRHAALFDFSDLRDASIQLRQLGQLWHPGDNDGYRFSKKNLNSNYYYRYNLNKLRFSAIGKLGSGDLSYRLQRSQFYADTFKSRVGDLRCKPIPPFQSYDAFMARNAYVHFDKFRSLSSRFRSAQNAMQYLETQNQTSKAENLNRIAVGASFIAILFGLTSIVQFVLEVDRNQQKNYLFSLIYVYRSEIEISFLVLVLTTISLLISLSILLIIYICRIRNAEKYAIKDWNRTQHTKAIDNKSPAKVAASSRPPESKR